MLTTYCGGQAETDLWETLSQNTTGTYGAGFRGPVGSSIGQTKINSENQRCQHLDRPIGPICQYFSGSRFCTTRRYFREFKYRREYAVNSYVYLIPLKLLGQEFHTYFNLKVLNARGGL